MRRTNILGLLKCVKAFNAISHCINYPLKCFLKKKFACHLELDDVNNFIKVQDTFKCSI